VFSAEARKRRGLSLAADAVPAYAHFPGQAGQPNVRSSSICSGQRKIDAPSGGSTKAIWKSLCLLREMCDCKT
jgi:hypothetical protein